MNLKFDPCFSPLNLVSPVLASNSHCMKDTVSLTSHMLQELDLLIKSPMCTFIINIRKLNQNNHFHFHNIYEDLQLINTITCIML